jgi:hypothetical protein
MNPFVALTRLRARLCLVAASALLGLSACGSGGGGGGSNNTTSRDLPADPGPAATATADGVDTNSNGVRDEVERNISTNTPADTDFNATMQVAAAYQKFIASPTPANRAEALALYGAVACAGGGGSVYAGSDGKFLLVETFNTPERVVKYQAIGKQIGGGFSSDELPSCP